MNRSSAFPTEPSAVSGPAIRRGHWICFALFLLATGWVGLDLWRSGSWRETFGLGEALWVLTALLTTLVSLSRWLPAQNVVLAASIIAVVAGVGHATAAGLGYSPIAPPNATVKSIPAAAPWTVPLLWIIAILNSRGVAMLMLRGRELRAYGYWLLGLTWALSLAFDFGLEPSVWRAAPVSQFTFRTVTTVLILVLATPSLINKRPGTLPPDYHPLVIWILLNLVYGCGALVQRAWPAAAFSFTISLLSVVAARRGAQPLSRSR